MQKHGGEAFGQGVHALVPGEAQKTVAAPGLRLASLAGGLGQGVGADQAQARQPFGRQARGLHGDAAAQGMGRQGEARRRLVEQGLSHRGEGAGLAVARDLDLRLAG